MPSRTSDAVLAGIRPLLDAARAGIAAIREAMTATASYSSKPDGSLISTADLRSNEAVLATLARTMPGVAIHSEEALHNGPLDRGAVLAVDPLDGTTNYTRGIPLFGVSIGLLEEGVPRLGVVAAISGDVYFAERGRGSYHAPPGCELADAARLRCADKPLAESILSISTDQSDENGRRVWWRWLERLKPPTCFRLRNIETAAIELCWLAMGRLDAHLHPKDKVWDQAAGALIASEAGAVLLGPDLAPWKATGEGIIALTPALAGPVKVILAAP